MKSVVVTSPVSIVYSAVPAPRSVPTPRSVPSPSGIPSNSGVPSPTRIPSPSGIPSVVWSPGTAIPRVEERIVIKVVERATPGVPVKWSVPSWVAISVIIVDNHRVVTGKRLVGSWIRIGVVIVKFVGRLLVRVYI